ncbi:hypothetical protein predicted by Glimmer/Critica [Limosilactobacillus fermentum]|nr:hypothetical protein predicted by Glimmer/Critica [Limosilactobacillus fermentum]
MKADQNIKECRHFIGMLDKNFNSLVNDGDGNKT